MTQTNNTADRILLVALDRFMSRGIRDTSIADIAVQAGTARLTVYRHFGNKKELVRRICIMIASLFEVPGREDSPSYRETLDARLRCVRRALATVPRGRLFSCLDEIREFFPDVYYHFRNSLEASCDALISQALTAAGRDAALCDSPNSAVFSSVCRAASVGLLDRKELLRTEVSLVDVFDIVTNILRHGILEN